MNFCAKCKMIMWKCLTNSINKIYNACYVSLHKYEIAIGEGVGMPLIIIFLYYRKHNDTSVMASNPLKLASKPKRRRVSTDFTKCIICQKNDDDQKLRKSSQQGLNTFLSVLQLRNDAGYCCQYDYLETILKKNDSLELEFLEPVPDIVWHKNCYSSFTSSTNVATSVPSTSSDIQPSTSSQRVSREAFDFKELCMFCGKKNLTKKTKFSSELQHLDLEHGFKEELNS